MSMKTKKELERFLTILELQEMMIPMIFPFKKSFIRSVIRFIRKYIYDMGEEFINLEELQKKIDAEIYPLIVTGNLTRWQTGWIVRVMDYLSNLE